MRNCITWLWRLRSPPKICKLETQESWWYDPVSASMIQRPEMQRNLQFDCKGLGTGSSNLSSSVRAGEDWCPSLKTIRQRKWIQPHSNFCSLQPSVVGWRPPIFGSGKRTNLLYSNVNLIQKHPYKYTQNNVDPNIWVPVGPVKLIHEINFTARLGCFFTLQHKGF